MRLQHTCVNPVTSQVQIEYIALPVFRKGMSLDPGFGTPHLAGNQVRSKSSEDETWSRKFLQNEV